ncbi:MAG: hypothetical protein QHH75_10825 [Bacillota bacterium]|nr:hypothetical protein [Bacillota bacterium]
MAPVERTAERLRTRPEEFSLLEKLEKATGLARAVPFEVDLWKAQNIYYRLLQEVYPELRRRAEKGEEDARAWISRFNSLGENLQVRRAPDPSARTTRLHHGVRLPDDFHIIAADLRICREDR